MTQSICRLPLIGFGLLLAVTFAASPVQAQMKPLREVIDAEIRAQWKEEKIEPAGRADDATFLRRVTLDLVGTVPTLDETSRFLADGDPNKRSKVIENLLADPRFAEAQANIWDLVLFGRHPGNIDATRTRPAFKAWLAKQFADNVAFDRLVKELLLAEQAGSEMFLVQFRNAPEEAAVHVSRIFLGTQLQCARCHDHPYDVWTQKDFFGVAGFFVRLVVQETAGTPKTYSIGEKMSGEVLFSGTAKDQAPGKKGEPVRAKYLGGAELAEPPLPKDFKEPALPKDGSKLAKPTFSRKVKFAEWLSASDNPYLARAAANRIWAQFMGRGIVHPVDNFNAENLPSHPVLLKALADGFATHKFDIKWLVREIVNSDAYQLAGTGPVRAALPTQFERARVRPLSAEEIVVALRTATSTATDPKNPNPGWEYFLRYFGEPTNGLGDFQGSLSEHLFVNNGEQMRTFIRRKKGNLTDQLLVANEPWEIRVERLFLTVLSRRPKPAEVARFVAYIKDDPKPDARLEDAIWVLLNSSEFRFNH